MAQNQRVIRQNPGKDLVAICNSDPCYLKKKGYVCYNTASYGEVKDVSIHEDYCPDCGHALVWIRKHVKPVGYVYPREYMPEAYLHG